MTLKNFELDSPSSAVTFDVLGGRESISTLDTERDEYCDNSTVDQAEQDVAPVTPRQAERTVSIHTWCKSSQ